MGQYPNDFWHNWKMYNFEPYNVLLAIATNIPVLLMTPLETSEQSTGIKNNKMHLIWLINLYFSLFSDLAALLFLNEWQDELHMIWCASVNV